MLETLDYTIRIGSTPTILYFDLYLYSACAAHYVYTIGSVVLEGLECLALFMRCTSQQITSKYEPNEAKSKLKNLIK